MKLFLVIRGYQSEIAIGHRDALIIQSVKLTYWVKKQLVLVDGIKF